MIERGRARHLRKKKFSKHTIVRVVAVMVALFETGSRPVCDK
jgi:hypothetical protein